MLESAFDEFGCLGGGEDVGGIVGHHWYAKGEGWLLSVEVDPLSLILRPYHHSHHKQSLHIAASLRPQSLDQRIAHHRHKAHPHMLIHVYRRVDELQLLGDEVLGGFESRIFHDFPFGKQLKVAAEGVEKKHSSAAVQQCADIDYRLL